MDVHLLGTAGYHPNNRRHTACVMIPQAGLIFDAGTGFFRVRDLIETKDLHIFLSHAHLDHCFGLSFFVDVVFEKEVENIFVYGQAEKLSAIREHLFSEHLFPLQPDFHWIELSTPTVDVPLDGKLTLFPLQHPGGSLGFRVDWPTHSLAYVTDTTADVDAEYVSQIRQVDCLLHECHFPDGFEELAKTTGHSCLTPVAEVSRAAEVGKTVLIHLNPLNEDETPLDLQTVQPIFDRLVLGYDQMVLHLPD